MARNRSVHQASGGSRREFLQGTTAVAGGVLASGLFVPSVHAADSATIKVGLIGCGGRGTGAIADTFSANPEVKLVAMGDAFPDRVAGSHGQLSKQFAARVDVPKDRQFSGWDAYQKVIDSGVDMVILATPPGFRPIHLAAAIKAGKHVFMEKPVATDAPGVRSVLASAEEAKKKNLAIGVGLQRRHQQPYLETVKRLHDGEIGDITSMRVYWNGSTPWTRPRQKGWTEMEYQMRNWYYFVWLCGDHIVEQHIHNLDVAAWVKGGYPVSATGMGGREVRKGIDHGETFDHHAVQFRYADGSYVFSECRHIEGCWNSVSEHAQGTKGSCDVSSHVITVKGGSTQRIRGGGRNPYEQEHVDLVASIKSGNPINEGEYGAKSTMMAIFGRLCTYSGKELKWETAINSNINLQPEQYAWDATPKSLPDKDGRYQIAVPGRTVTV